MKKKIKDLTLEELKGFYEKQPCFRCRFNGHFLCEIIRELDFAEEEILESEVEVDVK